jgi:hypothetical protein
MLQVFLAPPQQLDRPADRLRDAHRRDHEILAGAAQVQVIAQDPQRESGRVDVQLMALPVDL